MANSNNNNNNKNENNNNNNNNNNVNQIENVFVSQNENESTATGGNAIGRRNFKCGAVALKPAFKIIFRGWYNGLKRIKPWLTCTGHFRCSEQDEGRPTRQNVRKNNYGQMEILINENMEKVLLI